MKAAEKTAGNTGHTPPRTEGAGMMADHQPPPSPSQTSAYASLNGLGHGLVQRFGEPSSPCRPYSELERRSGVSRASISCYVRGSRAKHRSPTIATLAAARAAAIDLPLELLCRAALLPGSVTRDRRQVEQRRAEEVAPLLEQLTEAQSGAFLACVWSLLDHA